MKHKTLFKRGRLASMLGLLAGGMSLAGTAWAGCDFRFDPFLSKAMGKEVFAYLDHPCAQPEPGLSQVTVEGDTTYVVTPEGQHPPQDPFAEPPGSNFLMTVYENLRDYSNREMPNTMPSTPDNPYNLHDGPVMTETIDSRSPDQDLDMIIDKLEAIAEGKPIKKDWNALGGKHHKKGWGWKWKKKHHGEKKDIASLVQFGIDILEGNPIDRAYSGLAQLHYDGLTKVKKVEPEFDADGNVIGGNVVVNMFYWGQHIEADAMFIDPSAVFDAPWTITYRVHILHRGMEDFSPMVSHFNRIQLPDGTDSPPANRHASLDETFFPMLEEGVRYTVKVKQTKGKYLSLIYHWGWRIHPPRVQAIENATKRAGPNNWTLPQWEKAAFCEGGAEDPDCDPRNNLDDRMYAIAQIGDLSPAKRMWMVFKSMQDELALYDNKHRHHHHAWKKYFKHKKLHMQLKGYVKELKAAYFDWVDRTKLPAGVEEDPDATLTLLFVNNTIYGSRQGLTGEGSGQGPASFKGTANGSLHDWNIRPYNAKVTVYNGDNFMHFYRNVDFGGSRGWENQFQLTDPTTLEGPHPVIPPGHPANFDPFNNPANVVAGEENVFPINRGGTEEFLQPTPRNLTDPVNGMPQMGSGCFFTFGRNYLWPNVGGPTGLQPIPMAGPDGTPGMHKFDITFNYEPSRRLKMYQFDPLHHGVAIYSLH